MQEMMQERNLCENCLEKQILEHQIVYFTATVVEVTFTQWRYSKYSCQKVLTSELLECSQSNQRMNLIQRRQQPTMNRQSYINPKTTLLSFPLVNLREPSPKNKPLGHNFQPGPHDVICGRGKSVFWHDGNQEFRRYIDENADRYRRARSKLDKSLIVIEIVDCIRSNSPNGGFVKQIKPRGDWVEVGDALAREKVGHALRDAVNGKSYPSHPPEAYVGTTKAYLRPKRPTPSGCTRPPELDSAADGGNLRSMLAVASAKQRYDATESLDDFNTLDCDTLNIDMSFDPYSFVGDASNIRH